MFRFCYELAKGTPPQLDDCEATPYPTLVRFTPSDYYNIVNDRFIADEKYSFVVKIRPEGSKVVAAYYANKYQTIISRPARLPDDALSKLSVNDRDLYYIEDFEFVDRSAEFLQHARKQKSNEYRAAFIVGKGQGHNIPMIYFQENGEEALLYANTLNAHLNFVLDDLKKLYTEQKIKVYVVEDNRQFSYGCSVDSLVLAKDATAKDSKTDQYRIPRLLSQLKSRAQCKGAYYSALLPDELLKTSHQSKTVAKHQEKNQPPKIIHKKETLSEFRKRYTYTEVKMSDGTTKNLAGYLNLKGFKLAIIIEIQFYINQIRAIAPHLWNNAVRNDFIQQGKGILKQQFLDKHSQHSSGLYDFALCFLTRLRGSPLMIPASKSVSLAI